MRRRGGVEVAPGDVRHVTHDESSVYWAMADGELWSMPLGGGAPTSLGIVEEIGAPLTAHGGSLYWRQEGTNALGRIPIGGGAPEILIDKDVFDFAADATHVYWLFYNFETGDGTIQRIPIDGGEPELFAGSQTSPSRIEVDATYVYWSTTQDASGEWGSGQVLRRRK